MVIQNWSNYDYHFILKELAKEFEGEPNCLEENTESRRKKWKSFQFQSQKKLKGFVKMEKKLQKKKKSHKLQFLDRTRFIASSLSNIVDNHTEKIHKIKCKYGHDNKKCETCGIKYKHCDCCLYVVIRITNNSLIKI